jgi:hypothetical protein
VLNDLDVNLTEVLAQLDLEDALAAVFCSLSINAVASSEEGQALRLRALVKNKVMLMLVDSGPRHSFVWVVSDCFQCLNGKWSRVFSS